MAPPPPDSWKNGFPRRLGAYLGGVAIGLFALGLFQMAKRGAGGDQNPPGGAAVGNAPVGATEATRAGKDGTGNQKSAPAGTAPEVPGGTGHTGESK